MFNPADQPPLELVAWRHWHNRKELMFPNTKTLPALPAKAKDAAKGLSVCQVLSVVSPKATAERRPSRLPVPGLVGKDGKRTKDGEALAKTLTAIVPAAYKLDTAPKARKPKAKASKATTK